MSRSTITLVSLLLKAGVDPNARDDGDPTPGHGADLLRLLRPPPADTPEGR